MRRALVIGALGQIGVELSARLIAELGEENVVLSDIRNPSGDEFLSSQFEILDALNFEQISHVIREYQITEVYQLAAALSANAEKNPIFSWELNMKSLLNVLEIAKEGLLQKVFWPSSVAVFGPSSPSENAPQDCIKDPNTVYGISKLAGERWCQYYFENYNVDVRSVRFPGILGHKSDPGGGTTDYALWALKNAALDIPYISFLSPETKLPMMHMEDAVDSIWQIMDASPASVKIRDSYNISAVSFTPSELLNEIHKLKPGFKMSYQPDFRQKIADSWPMSMNDSRAKEDWGWQPKLHFSELVDSIISGFKKKVVSETF